MADAGIGEAAILAAAAESASAAAAAGGTAAATAALAAAPEVLGAGAAAAGAGAAAAAPEVLGAVAAPELVGAALPAATAATEVPAALGAGEAAPIVLGATQAEPVAGAGLLGGAETFGPVTAAETPGGALSGGILGGGTEFGPATASEASAYPGLVSGGPVTPAQLAAPNAPSWGGVNLGSGQVVDPTKASLLDKAGTWWANSSLGDKVSAGGKALSAVSGASKALSPSTPTKGPSRTQTPGKVGQPTGGEKALAEIVKNMLDKRDQYLGAQSGVPIAYRPRSLLG
jgi:hypothetical protein